MEIYFNFEGKSAQAMEFYQNVFHGTDMDIMRYRDLQDQGDSFPEEVKDLVLHGRLVVNGTPLMFSDVMPGTTIQKGNMMHLSHSHDSPEEIHRMFDMLSEGGTVISPLETTFFSQLYGHVEDRYGVSWMIMVTPQ